MSIPGAASPLFLAATAAGPAGDFSIARSLRFNKADSAYLNRTPSSASNRKTFTLSFWIKRTKLVADFNPITASVFGAAGGSSWFDVSFYTVDELQVITNAGIGGIGCRTQAVFRDLSAWMNFVIAVDTTDSTASDRIKIYVNGVRQDVNIPYGMPAQNSDTFVNSTAAHYLGRDARTSSVRYGDNYLTEVNFVDGSALDPTSFGAFDDNGVWQAIDTSGLTFGTNGFRLKFADNSDSTATTLGKDTSGNSNNWTPNNLSVGTVSNLTAKQNFDVVTYTGNGGTQSITGLSFQPDFVWIKNRSSFTNQTHALFDVIRGKEMLSSAYNGNEANYHGANGLPYRGYVDSFNSNGFTLVPNAASGLADYVNYNNTTYVAWAWKAGGAASSNSSGTITSSISANASYGFSVVTWTGDGSSSATVGHGLSSTPAWVIVKGRETTDSWSVYHSGLTSGHVVLLNSTSASFAASSAGGGGVGTPTSNTITFTNGSSSVNNVNQNTKDFVAYVWSEVVGFSKFGSYTGNGSSSGPTVTTGFKPKFILMKRTDASGYNWVIFDAERNAFDERIYPNSNAAGATGITAYSVNSNGFTVSTSDTVWNASGGTYIYAAFAATIDEAAINDCFVDTPSNAAEPTDTGVGNEVVGNYATMSPVGKTKSEYFTEDGNLTCGNSSAPSGSSGNRGYVPSTIGFKTGKWYCECVTTRASDGDVDFAIGIYSQDAPGYYTNNGTTYNCRPDARLNSPGGLMQSYGTSWADGDVIGIAVDLDSSTKTIQWFKNNVATGSAVTISTDHEFFFGYGSDGGGGSRTYKATWNFGQRAFAYTAPSGYKSLNTANLPTPTIADGSDYFDSTIYTGNGSGQTIALTNSGFSPDLVWIKSRNQSANHWLVDVVRGADQRLISSGTQAEASGGSSVISFTSTGFVLGTDSYSSTNENNDTYVAWTWDAGTSTVTNNDGSIASQVRANPSAGFSIVGWSGQSGTNTVGHGLNAAPELIILKGRTNAGAWAVGSDYIGWGNRLELNTTAAASSSPADFNSTAPTSSVFTAGSNQSSGNKIAYCFAPVAGYSAMGSYTGNGSSDGPFIHTGFKVAFLLTKRTDTSENWEIRDIRRNPYNRTNRALFPHTSGTEDNGSVDFDFLSNGFKLRNINGSTNANGGTYIYYAVAANPFQANGGLAR